MKIDTTKLTATQADALRLAAREAMGKYTATNLDLAKILYTVYHASIDKSGSETSLVNAWGHDNFDEWAEHEVGIHQGPARRLVLLHEELFVHRSLDPEQLPKSPTKLRQLARISKHAKDGREFSRWQAKALEMSPCEFQAAVDEALGSESSRLRHIGIGVKFGQFNALMKRLREAKQSFGVQTNGEALTRIVTEWSQLHHGTDRVRARARAS